MIPNENLLPRVKTLGILPQMDLSQTTIELLRDEAYAFLSREAVKDGLDRLARERAEMIDVCPAQNATRNQVARETLNRSMRRVMDQEESLRKHLTRISQLEQRLQGAIHPELHDYLMTASTDYGRLATASKLLEHWKTLVRGLPARLVAFANDVRQILRETTTNGGRPDLRLFVALRDSAQGLEQDVAQLDECSVLLAANVAPGGGIFVPTLPDFHRVAWVSRLFLLPAPQLASETARVETEVRQFLAHDLAAVLASLLTSQEACQGAAENVLQGYWNQLRTHAQVYYVEDRDMDEVIDELMRRHVAPAVDDRPLAGTTAPFAT